MCEIFWQDVKYDSCITALALLPEVSMVTPLTAAIFMLYVIDFMLKFGVKKWNSTISRI